MLNYYYKVFWRNRNSRIFEGQIMSDKKFVTATNPMTEFSQESIKDNFNDTQ